MKRLSLFTLIAFFATSCHQNLKSLKDIDGNIYEVIIVGQNYWMTENLRVKRDSLGNAVPFFFPDGDLVNAESFGLLYDFENACKVCPKGWRLPNNEEWEELLKINIINNAGNFKDSQFWTGESNSNVSGFSVRPAGIGNNQEHPNNFGENTLFWSSSKEDQHFIWTYIFEKGSNNIRKASQHPTYAFSVRCTRTISN